jgi:hypothetical protein
VEKQSAQGLVKVMVSLPGQAVVVRQPRSLEEEGMQRQPPGVAERKQQPRVVEGMRAGPGGAMVRQQEQQEMGVRQQQQEERYSSPLAAMVRRQQAQVVEERKGQLLVRVLPAQVGVVRQRPTQVAVGMVRQRSGQVAEGMERIPAQQVVAWHCWAQVMVAGKEKAVVMEIEMV